MLSSWGLQGASWSRSHPSISHSQPEVVKHQSSSPVRPMSIEWWSMTHLALGCVVQLNNALGVLGYVAGRPGKKGKCNGKARGGRASAGKGMVGGGQTWLVGGEAYSGVWRDDRGRGGRARKILGWGRGTTGWEKRKGACSVQARGGRGRAGKGKVSRG